MVETRGGIFSILGCRISAGAFHVELVGMGRGSRQLATSISGHALVISGNMAGLLAAQVL